MRAEYCYVLSCGFADGLFLSLRARIARYGYKKTYLKSSRLVEERLYSMPRLELYNYVR